MQSTGALGHLCQISIFQCLRERIKQRPDITLFKLPVSGLTPFVQDGRNEPVGADTDITGPDDEVMSFFVLNHDLFVGFDALSMSATFSEVISTLLSTNLLGPHSKEPFE